MSEDDPPAFVPLFQAYLAANLAECSCVATRPLPPYPERVLEAFEVANAPFIFPEDLRYYLTHISREYPLPKHRRKPWDGMFYGQYQIVQHRHVVPLYGDDNRSWWFGGLETASATHVDARYAVDDVYRVTNEQLDLDRRFAESLVPPASHYQVVDAVTAVRRICAAWAVAQTHALEVWRVWAELHADLVSEGREEEDDNNGFLTYAVPHADDMYDPSKARARYLVFEVEQSFGTQFAGICVQEAENERDMRGTFVDFVYVEYDVMDYFVPTFTHLHRLRSWRRDNENAAQSLQRAGTLDADPGNVPGTAVGT